MMLLSFIVPVYNREKILVNCVESVLQANSPEIEIILIDDGSTDNSASICKKYANQSPNVQFIQMPTNQGPGAARNAGMQIARGDFFYFLDSDDQVFPEYIHKFLCALKQNPTVEMFAINAIFIKNAHRQPSGFVSEEKQISIEEFLLMNPTVMNIWFFAWNRSFLRKHTIVFPQTHYAEDTAVSAQGLLYAKSIYTIPYPVYGYRVFSENSLVATLDKHQKRAISGLTSCFSVFSLLYKSTDSKIKQYALLKSLNEYIANSLSIFSAKKLQALIDKAHAFPLQEAIDFEWFDRHGTELCMGMYLRILENKLFIASEQYKKKYSFVQLLSSPSTLSKD